MITNIYDLILFLFYFDIYVYFIKAKQFESCNYTHTHSDEKNIWN
jgi:hypothetical protein